MTATRILVIALGVWAAGELLGRFHSVDKDNLSTWLRWSRKSRLRWVVKPVLAVVAAVFIELQIRSAVAAISAGMWPAIGYGVQLLVGIGLGLSVGRHLARSDYSVVGT